MWSYLLHRISPVWLIIYSLPQSESALESRIEDWSTTYVVEFGIYDHFPIAPTKASIGNKIKDPHTSDHMWPCVVIYLFQKLFPIKIQESNGSGEILRGILIDSLISNRWWWQCNGFSWGVIIIFTPTSNSMLSTRTISHRKWNENKSQSEIGHSHNDDVPLLPSAKYNTVVISLILPRSCRNKGTELMIRKRGGEFCQIEINNTNKNDNDKFIF